MLEYDKNNESHRRKDRTEDIVYEDGIMIAKFNKFYKHPRIFNHLEMTVEVHGNFDKWKIVGFEVEPKSIDWGQNPCGTFDDPDNIPPLVY